MKVDPKDLREGDRVRITLEGTFIKGSVDDNAQFVFDGETGGTWLSMEELSHAEITRLDPQIRVGDRVKDFTGRVSTVKSIDNDNAWLRFDVGTYNTLPIARLTRISENPQ